MSTIVDRNVNCPHVYFKSGALKMTTQVMAIIVKKLKGWTIVAILLTASETLSSIFDCNRVTVSVLQKCALMPFFTLLLNIEDY
jgi:hypothetical protein